MSSQKDRKVQEARAVVIKEKNVGESNKQLTLLAKDLGKLTVSARGAKNQKSKFLSGSQIFCYGDFILYDGGEFLAVTQIDLIRNFSVYYDDIFKLLYGTYFLELIDKTVMFSQESNDIMLLLLKSLHMLEKTGDTKKISAAFQIKLFDLLGFCPDTVCSVCGGEELYFSEAGFAAGNGFLCRKCGEAKWAHNATKASKGLLDAISFIRSSENVFNFMVSDKVLDELNTTAEMIVKSHLDAHSGSLEIIKRL